MVGGVLFSGLGYKTFFFICGMSVFLSIICWLFMPETAGRTLEDIDNLFNSKEED
jgi:Sugar (and other) transporter.